MALTSEQRDEWRHQAEHFQYVYRNDGEAHEREGIVLALLDALEEAEQVGRRWKQRWSETVDYANAYVEKLARVEALLEPAVIYDAIHPADPPSVIRPAHIKARHLRAALADPEPRDEGGES